MGSSPYEGLPAESFWRSALAQRTSSPPTGLYRARLSIGPDTGIAVAGDCFAQQIARLLRSATAATVLDLEPPPPGMSDRLATRYGYKLFSARYGNIYFTRQLRQLIDEAYGRHEPQDAVWSRDGRYFDALRPLVEPNGLASADEVVAHRRRHLSAVRSLFESMDLFLYSFGLNEGWVHTESGTVYPSAPSVIAGTYDSQSHHWQAFGYRETYEDFRAALEMLREINPRVRALIMVAPVPGAATMTGKHILIADAGQKAVLRAVAGAIAEDLDFADYFPAYELIATQLDGDGLFDAGRRCVSAAGLATVMQMLLAEHPELRRLPPESHRALDPTQAPLEDRGACREEDVDLDGEAVCEDALLDAFAP
jgi:hypothetical protein